MCLLPQLITVTIKQATHERLSELSYEQGRSLSNLVAYLVELRLDEKEGEGRTDASRK